MSITETRVPLRIPTILHRIMKRNTKERLAGSLTKITMMTSKCFDEDGKKICDLDSEKVWEELNKILY